jgi:hypothetical protein
MNLVVFAADAKHLSYLNSIINEAVKRELNIFALICQDTQLKYPLYHKDRFQILTNCEPTNPTFSETLGVTLPFNPDWLIVSRERWSPESDIIHEFKLKFKSKIGLVEPNSAMVSSVNQFLESHSKNRFKDVIDVFFDHSEFINKQRKLLGFEGNTVVVGNPKHDINLNINEEYIKSLKEFYKIDPNKKQVLFFTLQNKYRYPLFEELKKFKSKHPEYQYFVKPYPGEPFDPLFNKEYFPKFFIEGVTPILEESHIWSMYHICDIHMGAISSVMYSSFFLDKEIYEFSEEIGARKGLDSNFDIINGSSGHEDKLEIWLNTFNIDLDGFKQLTSPESMKPMLKNNNKIWKNLNDSVYYRKDILKMYDEFNDKQASKRIIDYITSYEK